MRSKLRSNPSLIESTRERRQWTEGKFGSFHITTECCCDVVQRYGDVSRLGRRSCSVSDAVVKLCCKTGDPAETGLLAWEETPYLGRRIEEFRWGRSGTPSTSNVVTHRTAIAPDVPARARSAAMLDKVICALRALPAQRIKPSRTLPWIASWEGDWGGILGLRGPCGGTGGANGGNPLRLPLRIPVGERSERPVALGRRNALPPESDARREAFGPEADPRLREPPRALSRLDRRAPVALTVMGTGGRQDDPARCTKLC